MLVDMEEFKLNVPIILQVSLFVSNNIKKYLLIHSKKTHVILNALNNLKS